MNMAALTVVDHPLVQHKLSLLRDERTPTVLFRRLLKEVGVLLTYEATRDLAVENVEISTPLETVQAPRLLGRKLALISDDARSWLFIQLGSQSAGSSAALALARISDDRVFDQVRETIVGNGSELSKLRAVLVLRLSETETAATMQNQLRSRSGLSLALKRALQ